MCMLSWEISHVGKTQLFACPSLDGTRQLTVYSNVVDTPAENIMVLPVPFPESVKFETVHKELFTECDNSFPKLKAGRGGSEFRNCDHMSTNELKIIDHGSYQVVLVPSLADLERVPSGFAAISEGLRDYIRASYNPSYGVIVCKLKPGSINYEPFAYSHTLLDSKHLSDNSIDGISDFLSCKQLFLPTRHYHKHKGDSTHRSRPSGRSMFDGIPVQPLPPLFYESNRVVDDWDHDIYIMYPDWEQIRKQHEFVETCVDRTFSNTNEINWSKLPKDFQHDKEVSIGHFKYYGQGTNKDYIYQLNAIEPKPVTATAAAAPPPVSVWSWFGR